MNKFKRILLNWCVKSVLHGTNENDTLKFIDGVFFYKGNILSDKDSIEIIAGARALKEIRIYNIVLEDLKTTCADLLINKSTCDDDIVFSKAGLWMLDVIEKKIDNLSKIEWKK